MSVIVEQAKRKVYNIIGKAINSIAQNEAGNTSDIPKTVTDGAPELICKAGIEGSVLLRNDDVLPFKKTDKISVFFCLSARRAFQAVFYIPRCPSF